MLAMNQIFTTIARYRSNGIDAWRVQKKKTENNIFDCGLSSDTDDARARSNIYVIAVQKYSQLLQSAYGFARICSLIENIVLHRQKW